ncbi:MAG: YIP1 family protein [Rhodobacteraceae bacterium]|nr:YIP1 family protein [Paracoccaceae bacterium]
MDLRDMVIALTGESLRRPKEAARRLIALDPPFEARWIGLGLISVLSLLTSRIMALFIPDDRMGPLFALISDPWLGAPLQAASLLVIAFLVTFVGRLFGGRGGFMDALLLVVWLQFLLILAQALQIAALFLMPPLALLIAVAALALFVWLLVNFIAALHGFSSLAKVILGMVASFVVIVLLLSVLLVLAGVAPMEAAHV